MDNKRFSRIDCATAIESGSKTAKKGEPERRTIQAGHRAHGKEEGRNDKQSRVSAKCGPLRAVSVRRDQEWSAL